MAAPSSAVLPVRELRCCIGFAKLSKGLVSSDPVSC